MSKSERKMSDAEVLEAVGNCGPAIVGQELYDRAVEIRKNNPEGKYGPAILNDEPEKKKPRAGSSARKAADESEEEKKEAGGEKEPATKTDGASPVTTTPGKPSTHPATPAATAARRTPRAGSSAKAAKAAGKKK